MDFIKKFAVQLLFLCLFLAIATPTQAATLYLPNFYYYQGLSFLEPLPEDILLSSNKISFDANGLGLTRDASPKVYPTISLAPIEKLALDPITPTPTAVPTSIPTTPPTITPTPSSQPTETIKLSDGGLDGDKLFSMSNSYRQSKGLPAFQKDDRVCSLAASRAPEVNAEIAEGKMHAGLKARNLTYWNTENIISLGSEEAAFNWWINDPIHHDAIVGNYTYSCVACSGYACAQEFTNFQAK